MVSHLWENSLALILILIKNLILPWLVWLSGLSASLQTKGSLVQFPVRAHAWVAGQVPSGGRVPSERQPHIDISLLLFLPAFSSLKINK